MKNYVMITFKELIKSRRLEIGMKINELARAVKLDASLISRYEAGKRLPPADHVQRLSSALSMDFTEVKKVWLSEKVVSLVQYESNPEEILVFAEERIAYLTKNAPKSSSEVSGDIRKRLDNVNVLQKDWSSRKPLQGTQLMKMREYFNIEYTYESNRIEGNTLTLKETELVVNQGLTIGGKSMIEHLEAINHSEASDFIYDLVANMEDLSKKVLLELHLLILKSIDRENAGRFRSVPVRISGSEHVPPQPYQLNKLMEDYFLFYQSNKSTMHPVILAAEMHERLVSIHPFIDGNGRTSRLVMNLILLRNGYTIANLKGDLDSRMKYYKSLEEVQVNNKSEDFYNFIINAVEVSLNRHIELA